MVDFHNLGFPTWIGSVLEIANKYNIDPYSTIHSDFKFTCKQKVRKHFEDNWSIQIRDISSNPGLRHYSLIKMNFGLGAYLKHVVKFRYWHAITKLRTSSHNLEIETGRHQSKSVQERLCPKCNIVGDEIHFVLQCTLNDHLRQKFIRKVETKYLHFTYMTLLEQYRFLLTSEDPQLLTWLGKFLSRSFEERSSNLSTSV